MMRTQGKQPSAAAQIFLGILAALVGLPSLALITLAVRHFREGSDQAWVPLSAGLVFGFVAALFAIFSVLAARDRRMGQAIAGRRALHPNEPWLWSEEWREGRIQEGGRRSTAIALIIFAAFWNVMVALAAVMASRRYDLFRTPSLGIFLLIFGVVGLFLIGLAVYFTLQARKFDPSVFEMSSLPGVLGGFLSGVIQLPRQVPQGTEINVELTCERTSGSGKTRTTSCLWKDATSVRASAGLVPVYFTIPFDLPPSDLPDEEGTTRVHWWLNAKAGVSGVDYHALFDVPVFATGTSNHSIVAGKVDSSLPVGRPANAKTSILESGPGRTVFAVPPVKGLGCAVIAVLVCPLLAWAISYFGKLEMPTAGMVYGGALFLCLGILTLLCIGILLTPARIEIDRASLRVPHGRGPLRWTRTVPLPEVAGFKYSTSGNPPTQSVEVHTRDGRSYTVLADLSGIQEAKWLTAELTSGLQRHRGG
jgi:hypothetical protein